MGESGPAWEHAPAVVLAKIYNFLPVSERLTASTTCHQWREAVFQVPLVTSLHLELARGGVNLNRLRFLVDEFVWKLESLSLVVDPNLVDVWEILQDVLTTLFASPKLKSLKIRFTDNAFFSKNFNYSLQSDRAFATRNVISRCFLQPLLSILGSKNCLQTFSCPLINELASDNATIYSALAANRRYWYSLVNICLATFRAGPENAIIPSQLTESNCGISLFVNLKKLSIDYDALTDQVLAQIGVNSLSGGLDQISVIATRANACTTDEGWSVFTSNNQHCKVRMTLMGSKVTFDHNSNLLMRSMPISHFRALYCRGLKISCLNSLIAWNTSTLEHLELVNENVSWESILEARTYGNDQFFDPIIYAAWRCHNLTCIKITYRYHGDSLVGIARLRGPALETLDVPKSQISCYSMPELCKEVSKALRRPWKPSTTPVHLKPVLHKMFERSMKSFDADEDSLVGGTLVVAN